jgi:hypothetical protein
MIGSIDHFVGHQIQYGARGAAMGRLVAERLGFRFYSAPSHHDLVVNAGTLGVEGAAAQTVSAFNMRFGAA